MPAHPMSVNVNTRVRWDAVKDMDWARDLRGKRVADVGCGLGFFSEKFKQRGATVVSLDVDRAALDYVSRTYGTETHFLDIETDPLPGDPYDVVFVGEVLEHMKEPGAVYRSALRSLKPGGALIVTTPALEGWLTHSKGKQLGHDHGGQKHEREGFYTEELEALAAANGLRTVEHRFCLYSLAELFMQVTKLGYLASKKDYEGQSDVLDLTRGLSYRVLRVVFPAMWALFKLEDALMRGIGARGHCHVQVASPARDSAAGQPA